MKNDSDHMLIRLPEVRVGRDDPVLEALLPEHARARVLGRPQVHVEQPEVARARLEKHLPAAGARGLQVHEGAHVGGPENGFLELQKGLKTLTQCLQEALRSQMEKAEKDFYRRWSLDKHY